LCYYLFGKVAYEGTAVLVQISLLGDPAKALFKGMTDRINLIEDL
jgi:hypothetical protein